MLEIKPMSHNYLYKKQQLFNNNYIQEIEL